MLRIDPSFWEIMRQDVILRAPEEACGLLAGLQDVVKEVRSLTNILHSPVRYRMHPQEQYDAFISFEEQGWELLGIYHSHPLGPDQPSPTDINEAYYPDAIYLIWFGGSGAWSCRGFRIQQSRISEIKLLVEP
jgi:proteasome lid subunit RPN8/RPN11